MLPIDREAEKVDVELARLRFIEDAQDRCGFAQRHEWRPREPDYHGHDHDDGFVPAIQRKPSTAMTSSTTSSACRDSNFRAALRQLMHLQAREGGGGMLRRGKNLRSNKRTRRTSRSSKSTTIAASTKL